MSIFAEKNYWALILGGSSGIGLASAKKLAKEGMNVFIVHRTRRSALPVFTSEMIELKKNKVQVCETNINALTNVGQEQILSELEKIICRDEKIRVLIHSIAAGNLKPLAPRKNFSQEKFSSEYLAEEDFLNTISAMGTSLWAWSRSLLEKNFFASDARIIGLTSEGSTVAWRGYAAVSAAKASLEAIARSMAQELAPHGIRTNIIQAGVTNTLALQAIPGFEEIISQALKKNPFGRLTTPEDIANVISLLCQDEAAWINGAVVRADGGEFISGGV